MDASKLLTQPSSVLSRIYIFLYDSRDVEVEVKKEGDISTRYCKLLRICRRLGKMVIEACQQRMLRLVLTVESPAALSSLVKWQPAALQITTVRFRLLTELEGLPLTMKDEVEWNDGPHTERLSRAWREAFRSVPPTIETAYFDLSRSFNIDQLYGVSRLIHNLSAILMQRTHRVARCQIEGCLTAGGQLFFEGSTINVVRSEIPGKKAAAMEERFAGPTRESAVDRETRLERSTLRHVPTQTPPLNVPPPVIGTKRKSEDSS